MALATAEALFWIDVRPIQPTVTVLGLVIHVRGDLIPVQGGPYLADHIPGAGLPEVDGADHSPWLTDPDAITSGIEECLTGSHAAPSHSLPDRRRGSPGARRGPLRGRWGNYHAT